MREPALARLNQTGVDPPEIDTNQPTNQPTNLYMQDFTRRVQPILAKNIPFSCCWCYGTFIAAATTTVVVVVVVVVVVSYCLVVDLKR